MNKKMENFVEAFDPGVGSSTNICVCGKEFYNPDGGWDWEEGELERLEQDTEATPLEWSVSYVTVNGIEYIQDCTCWHDEAKQVMRWMDTYRHQVAAYYALEKKRKQAMADDVPLIDDQGPPPPPDSDLDDDWGNGSDGTVWEIFEKGLHNLKMRLSFKRPRGMTR